MSWYKKNINGKFKRYLISEWEDLLNQNLTENHYQTYLTNNAGFLLASDNCHLVIAKLKLGSELETDFVTLTDGFSNGNQFELIEIKQPKAKLFNKNGTISSELNKATQQVRDWKRWLIDNKGWTKKYLPTLSTRVLRSSYFKYKIIIGRRLTNPYDIDKRNQIAEDLGAEIRSFDYLTDRLKRNEFYPSSAWLDSKNSHFIEELSNPFFKAISDSQWKKFCNNVQVSGFHFYNRHFKNVLESRKYNSKYKF